MVPKKSDLELKVEHEILKTLRSRKIPYPPANLINKLLKDKHLSDAIIRETIWQLLNDKQIELTDDLKLKIQNAA